jgi:hypothetical protein
MISKTNEKLPQPKYKTKVYKDTNGLDFNYRTALEMKSIRTLKKF